ncbi:ankyrin repeat protein [Colletotrichum tofieldiae]|nr:ankyrin repeat protein [Colletotrichum tofieldiae]GKT75644.1 ankyrin repeat protein [Colletotrichum tofieldiae]
MQCLPEVQLPILWDRAFASLSSDDKNQLSLGHGVEQPQSSELLWAVEEKKLDCEKKQWTVYVHRSMEVMDLQATLGRIHGSLGDFKEVADQVQRPSSHAFLLWAGLKTLLHVSFIDSQVFGTTLDNIEAILGLVTRYTKLEVEVFDRSSDSIEKLSAGVVKLYSSVLRYLAQAIRYYSQKQLGTFEPEPLAMHCQESEITDAIGKALVGNTSDSPNVDFYEPLLRFEKQEEKVRELLRDVTKEIYAIDVFKVATAIHAKVEAYNSWSRRQAWDLLSSVLGGEPLQKKDQYDAVPQFLEENGAQLLLALTAVSMSSREISETFGSNPGLFGVQIDAQIEEGEVEDLEPAEMYRSMRMRCMGIVRYILDEGHEIDEATDRSWEAATLTCLSELRRMVAAVVQRPTGLLDLLGLLDWLTGANNQESLMLPIQKWTDSVLDAMVRHGASGNILFPDRTTALDRAMKSPAMVRSFLENGTDPNDPNGKWWPPLVIASATGDVEVVKALIEGGARVDGNPDPEHHLGNPLHAAISERHLEVAKLLLDHGADINHKTRSGMTALMPAVSEADLQSAEWLLDMGASMQGIRETQEESVFTAVDMDDGSGPDLRRLLVRRGCFRVSLQGDSQAPRPASEALEDDCLAMKAFDGDIQGVGSLLEGSTRFTTHQLGEALMVASALGHLEIVKALLSHGVEIDLTDINGRTALHSAVTGEHFVVADLLAEHGASISMEDITGSTPFDLAIAHGSKATEFIKKHLDSFVALTINRHASLTETSPGEAPSQTTVDVRKAISGSWFGFYRYLDWRLMEEGNWSIRIPKAPSQGPQPSTFLYEGRDEDEFCLHGFVDLAGTIWFIKLYGDEGWLFKGELDSRLQAMKGEWGRNRKLWFGSFDMVKMPF